MSGTLVVTPNPAKSGDTLVATGSGYGTKASLSTNLTGAQNDLTYTAKTYGTGGNSITVTYVDPVGNNAALSVGVVGNAITVNLATDGSSNPTSTAAQIKAAIEASAPANALVAVALKTGNDGTGVAIALSSTPLAGGAEASVTVEFLKSSNADAEVKYIVTTTAGAFSTSGVVKYILQESGDVTVRTIVAGVVVAEEEVDVFTSS